MPPSRFIGPPSFRFPWDYIRRVVVKIIHRPAGEVGRPPPIIFGLAMLPPAESVVHARRYVCLRHDADLVAIRGR
jgi:hypothetical protein